MAENNTPNDLTNPHDKFFKAAMGIKQVAIDCSRQFLPKDILDQLDLDTLEVETTSYEGSMKKKMNKRIVFCASWVYI